jgi:hypothetical protein
MKNEEKESLKRKTEERKNMNNYKELVLKLDFSNVHFEDLPVEVGEKINEIVVRFFDNREQIIDLLPENIRIVYLIGEFESAILNDGLFSVFYNSSLQEIIQIREAIEKTNSTKLLKLFDKAKSLFENEYVLKSNTTFVSENPNEDVYDFFSEKLQEKIELIEEKISELQDSGEYWNRIEKFFK